MPPPTPAERAILRALCDTFVPGWSGSGDDADPELLGRVAMLVGLIEDPLARRRFGSLLGALDSPVVNLLFGSRAITRSSQDERIDMLRGWGESRLPLRRAGFQAVKRLIHVAHYAFPTRDGDHPVWRAAGYPGPLPHAAGEADSRLPEVAVTGDITLECDVVVVGSGAGGGVAAGVLAQAGRSVIVLEKGRQYTARDLTHVEGEALGAQYLDHGLLVDESGSLPILAGSVLGGGTAINYTTSLPLPERTRDEWSRLSGVPLFGQAAFAESLARVDERLGVSTQWSTPSPRDAILEAGCKALGWHVDTIRRNVRGCPDARACGYCGYGCRHGAKQSTAATYLADAVAAGARIVTGCEAGRITVAQGRATGVTARVARDDGSSCTVTVHAKAVVAACGAVHTPGLLARSGLNNPAIGRGLRLHPATAVGAYFTERVEPWVGFQQTRYSNQFADIAAGYGAMFETASVAFALPASAFGWESPEQHRAEMVRLGHMSLVGVLLRDRDAGTVVTGKDGRPRVHYSLSRHDIGTLRVALKAGGELLASQGALEIFSLQQPPVRAVPGAAGWLDAFAGRMDARGYDRCRMGMISFHQMASCAMGAHPRRSVVDETGESHDVRGVFVADASLFPTSSGVNPMITIMALADHVARGIAARW